MAKITVRFKDPRTALFDLVRAALVEICNIGPGPVPIFERNSVLAEFVGFIEVRLKEIGHEVLMRVAG